MRSIRKSTFGNGSRGFTLVELIVAVAIVAVLALVSVTMVRSVRGHTDQVTCANNLRQLGIALESYATDHGRYPETTHTAEEGRAWVALLEDYLGEYDKVRICPADPKKEERLEAEGTSYILNSFVFVAKTDPFGRPVGRQLNRPQNLPDPVRTILAFCCSDHVGVAPGNDHTHSDKWTAWSAVTRDIAPDRHRGDRSNYLFADGRVEVWREDDVRERIEGGDNFAKPPGI